MTGRERESEQEKGRERSEKKKEKQKREKERAKQVSKRGREGENEHLKRNEDSPAPAPWNSPSGHILHPVTLSFYQFPSQQAQWRHGMNLPALCSSKLWAQLSIAALDRVYLLKE